MEAHPGGELRFMKKILALLPALLIILFLCGCSEYQKSYESGLKLAAEGNYEEAIRKYRLAV